MRKAFVGRGELELNIFLHLCWKQAGVGGRESLIAVQLLMVYCVSSTTKGIAENWSSVVQRTHRVVEGCLVKYACSCAQSRCARELLVVS